MPKSPNEKFKIRNKIRELIDFKCWIEFFATAALSSLEKQAAHKNNAGMHKIMCNRWCGTCRITNAQLANKYN